MSCNNCPDPLDIPEDDGCLNTYLSSCINYDGETFSCANITEGATLNTIIESMATLLCELDESQYQFSCAELNSCSINDLADVVVSSPSSNQVLSWDGTKWVNSSIEFPETYTFSCSELSECELNSLGNVDANPTDGQFLRWSNIDGNWIAETVTIPTVIDYNSSNGITESNPSPGVNLFKLGGTLIENTSLLGAGSYFLSLGTNASKLSELIAKTEGINLSSTGIISLNDSDESTQSRGFRYDSNFTSISIGTDVFDDFSTYDGCIRIGSNITAAGPVVGGTFIGTDITLNGVLANAIGTNINLTTALGFYMGLDLNVNGGLAGAGGTMFGSDLAYTSGGTGNQSSWLFGSDIAVVHGAGIPQANLVFNIASTSITSSSTGMGTTDKIKVDASGKHIATFNVDEYYLFTNTGTGAGKGWAQETNLVIINSNWIRISQSTGAVTAEVGCIRYNPGNDKYQGYTTATGWTDLH